MELEVTNDKMLKLMLKYSQKKGKKRNCESEWLYT